MGAGEGEVGDEYEDKIMCIKKQGTSELVYAHHM